VNEAVYEPFIIPTHEDTVNYIRLTKQYPQLESDAAHSYLYLPLVRGWADTAVFNPRHYDRFKDKMWSYIMALQLAPLVVEGTICQITYEDTAKIDPNKNFFLTDISIKINDIFKSKYALNIGDTVMARVRGSGPMRMANGKLIYTDRFPATEFKTGHTFLFVLDRINYMWYFYNRTLKEKTTHDVYCPYSFEAGFTATTATEDYMTGKLTKKDIRQFFSHKHYSKRRLKQKIREQDHMMSW